MEKFRTGWRRKRQAVHAAITATLLGALRREFLSMLEVAEDCWVARVHVGNEYRREERVYIWRLKRRLGGRRAGGPGMRAGCGPRLRLRRFHAGRGPHFPVSAPDCRYDGIWYTDQLLVEGCNERTLLGVI